MRCVQLLLVIVLVATPAEANESCCAKAAAAVGGEAPEEWIPDPNVQKPPEWDDDEDGPWEPRMIKKPPPAAFEVFWREIINSINDTMPWLLLGLLTTGLFQGFSPSHELIRRHLVGQGIGVVVKGAVLGLLSPLCSCGALPLALGLASLGATAPAIVAFLVAAQSAGVDSLIFTVGVLGPVSAAWRMICAAVMATACGLAVPASTTSSSHHTVSSIQDSTVFKRITDGLYEALTASLKEVGPSIILGIVVASAVSAFLPAGGLALAVAMGGIHGRAAVLALALPLNFCEHAAVPLAVALQKAGATGGLAFAVLATLPGINLSSLGVVANFAGAVGALRVTLAMWLSGLVLSLMADLAEFEVTQIGHGDEVLPEWYVYASKWIVGAAVCFIVLRDSWNFIQSKEPSSCCNEKSCKSD